MSPPASLYLRHTDGSAVGPLRPRALEVLYDGRIIDEGTPISTNGRDFRALSEWPEIVVHLAGVKERLGRGEDVWAEDAPVVAGASGPSYGETTAVRVLLENAAARATGRLQLSGREGEVAVSYKDGNIVALETTVPDLRLAAYLAEKRVLSPAALADAEARAPMMGGDLGAALISMGAMEPHAYFEKLSAWAIGLLGRAIARGFAPAGLATGEAGPAAVPFGFDRLGVVFEACRQGLDRAELEARLLGEPDRPVIPSQVEGVKLEDTKLKPRELRVLNAVDGVKTVGDLIASFGEGEDAVHVLGAIFFAQQAGFVVLGDPSPRRAQSRARSDAEAPSGGKPPPATRPAAPQSPSSARPVAAPEVTADDLRTLEARMKGQNPFEVLGVTAESTDLDVRKSYTQLAKKYHPDAMAGAPEEVRALLQSVFARVNAAFEKLKTAEGRREHEEAVARGSKNEEEDLKKVQATLEAEALFTKGGLLLKVRKYAEALEQIDQAIALNPGDVEFKVYREYVAFCASGRKEPGRAIQKIKDLMRSQPDLASGHLFLGHAHKAAGEDETAMKHFKKVLEFDRTNLEAQQEIRLYNMRQQKRRR